MDRGAIDIGVDRDRPDPEVAKRAKDPDGDLAPVRDEDLVEHRRILPDMSFADQLTIGRAVSVPIVVALFAVSFTHHNYWATAVFIVAMATDWFDGRIARRSGRSSPLGSLLDPVADKLLVLATLIVLIDQDVFPAWMVAAIVARELLVSGLRQAAIERGVVIAARDLGKLKTWSQAIAAAVGGLAAAGAWSDRVAWWALLVALVLTWVSGLDYARAAPGLLRGRSATVDRTTRSVPRTPRRSPPATTDPGPAPHGERLGDRARHFLRLRRIRLRIHTKRVLRRPSIEGFRLRNRPPYPVRVMPVPKRATKNPLVAAPITEDFSDAPVEHKGDGDSGGGGAAWRCRLISPTSPGALSISPGNVAAGMRGRAHPPARLLAVVAPVSLVGLTAYAVATVAFARGPGLRDDDRRRRGVSRRLDARRALPRPGRGRRRERRLPRLRLRPRRPRALRVGAGDVRLRDRADARRIGRRNPFIRTIFNAGVFGLTGALAGWVLTQFHGDTRPWTCCSASR